MTRILLAALGLGAACGGPGSAATHPESAAGAGSAGAPVELVREPGFRDTTWGLVVSTNLSLKLALPERSSWTIEEAAQGWLTARHPATHSRLELRSWRAGGLVDRSDCERQVRLWRPELPVLDPELIVDQREVRRPRGYDTGVTLIVHSRAPGVEASALAFGGSVRRCLAVIFVTRAEGAWAEQVAGERLGFFVERILPRIRERSIDERVRRSSPAFN